MCFSLVSNVIRAKRVFSDTFRGQARHGARKHESSRFYLSTNVLALSQTRHQDARKTGKNWKPVISHFKQTFRPVAATRRRKKVVYIGKHAQYTAFNYTYRCGEVVINSQKNKLPLSWKHNWMALKVERSSAQQFAFKLPKNENAYCWNICADFSCRNSCPGSIN